MQLYRKDKLHLCYIKQRLSCLMNGSARNLYTLPSNNAKYQHGQVLWNMMRFHKGPALPPVGHIAHALSLAIVKSNFVIHGMIVVIVSAWTQGKLEEAEAFPTRDLLYLYAGTDARVPHWGHLTPLLAFYFNQL